MSLGVGFDFWSTLLCCGLECLVLIWWLVWLGVGGCVWVWCLASDLGWVGCGCL